MNSNYISTQSLYDSGSHLAHARQYSHKYIKREPDGKGGYRYYYKTDVGNMATSISGNRSDTHYSSYSREPGRYTSAEARSLKTNRFREATSYKVPSAVQSGPGRIAKQFREADKASQIYREGQSQNNKDYKSRVNQASKKTKPKVSKEYQEELEDNSKKNVYPETRINETIIPEKRIYENIITETDQLKTPKDSSKSVGDYAKQAVDTISTTAGSVYDKGKNFLKNLFK